jgi:hypothetical protein
MTLPVRVTARFERAVQQQIAYYRIWASRYPGSGRALAKVLRKLTLEVNPMLAEQPGIGRRISSAPGEDTSEREALARLIPHEQALNAELREWVVDEFVLLYVVTPDAVYLASLRHSKQGQMP